MLKELSVLELLPKLYNIMPTDIANCFVGILSALVDNVPLAAAILESGIEMNKSEWLSLTYAVGGSLLIIGSSAGVIALSKLEDLIFISYLKFIYWLFLVYTFGYVSVIYLAGICF